MGLDGLVKTLDNWLHYLKKEILDEWQNVNKKLAYPFEHFKSINDFRNPVNNIKLGELFSKLKNDYPDNIEIERTKGMIKVF